MTDIESRTVDLVDLDAERSVIGWAMLHGQLDADPADFGLARHVAIARCIRSALATRGSAGPVETADAARSLGLLAECGGPAALVDMIEVAAPAAASAASSAAIVREYAHRRRIVEAARAAIVAATDGVDPTDVAEMFAESVRAGSGSDSLLLRDWEAVAADPPIRWLVDDIVPMGGLVVLAGDPGAGKTLLALDAAMRAAHGMPWLGREVRPCSTLYVAGEGTGGLGARLRAWRAAHPEARATDGRYIVFADCMPNLAGPRAAADLDALLAAATTQHGHAPDVAVIDTWALALGGVDENDAGAVGAALRVLADARRRHGCAIVVVHHLRKAQPGARRDDAHALRGSSALHAAADVVLLAGADGGAHSLRAAKSRDAETGPPLRYAVQGQSTGRTRGDGRAEYGPVALPAPEPAAGPTSAADDIDLDVRAVVDAVAREGGRVQGVDSIARLASLPRARGRSAVAIAAGRGLLACVGTTRDRAYSLPPGGANGGFPAGSGSDLRHEVRARCIPHTPYAGGGANGARLADAISADRRESARIGANCDGLPEKPGGRRPRSSRRRLDR